MTVSSLKSGYRGDSMLAGNPDPGGMVALQTITVGAGGAASVTFDNIPQTYSHLQIRCRWIPQSANSNIRLRVNGDTGNNYSYHYLQGDGASATSGNGATQPWAYSGYAANGTNAATVIDILDYSSTSKNKTFRTLHGYDANGSGYVFLTSSAWYSTMSVVSLLIPCEGGTFAANSTFALYGIKSVGQ